MASKFDYSEIVLEIISEQTLQSVFNNRIANAFNDHLTYLLTRRMSTPAIKSAILQQEFRGVAELVI